MRKIEWMLEELQVDGFYPSEDTINRVLNGEHEVCDPAMADYIIELDSEWTPEGRE